MSILSFSLLFAYVLSFFFEGQAFYCVAAAFAGGAEQLLFAAMAAHLAGLAVCGFFVKSAPAAKKVMTRASGASALLTLPFFLTPSALWLSAITLAAFLCGLSVASWGWFLKSLSNPRERMKDCAAALIISNVIMIAANMASIHISGRAGLAIAVAALALSAALASRLPARESEPREGASPSISGPMAALCLFVTVITVDSGLMYQVINPAFEHLTWLTGLYWAVPYIAALAIMRQLPAGAHRAKFLYVGMAMIVMAFVSFALAGRGAAGYIVVDTFMLGACGIFDLFWWSAAAGMLDYTDDPAKVFGGCLAAHVGGVLIGGAIGTGLTTFAATSAQVSMLALAIVCVTTAMLPFLNNKLLSLLREHTWLYEWSAMTKAQRKDAVEEALESAPAEEEKGGLSERENEVLRRLVSGMTNRQTAEDMGISENTVKYYIKKIYAKYGVTTRAALVGKILSK